MVKTNTIKNTSPRLCLALNGREISFMKWDQKFLELVNQFFEIIASLFKVSEHILA